MTNFIIGVVISLVIVAFFFTIGQKINEKWTKLILAIYFVAVVVMAFENTTMMYGMVSVLAAVVIGYQIAGSKKEKKEVK